MWYTGTTVVSAMDIQSGKLNFFTFLPNFFNFDHGNPREMKKIKLVNLWEHNETILCQFTPSIWTQEAKKGHFLPLF